MNSLQTLAALAISLTAVVGCSRTDTQEPKFAEGTHVTTARAEKPSQAPTSSFSASRPPMDSAGDEELQGASRPRLSRTLRLGVDTNTYESTRIGAAPQTASGVTVIVNNNISQQQTAMSGGYGGYRGYGGYGYGNNTSAGGYSGSRNFTTSPGASPLPQPQAPASAPRVGGDWSPPRNYGPPAMR